MYHPYVYKYIEAYEEINGIEFGPLEKVVSRVKASLRRYHDIMDLHWITLAQVLDVPKDTYHRVYAGGWDSDPDTKRLREIFEQIVSPVPLDKRLEDYL